MDEVRENTGFDFDCPDNVGEVPPPPEEWLSLIRTTVAEQIAETYRRFAAEKLGWEGAVAD